jgi:dolichyl-phosphate-mannose--protein O-mannosyl transferase
MLFGIGAEKVSEKRYIFTFGIVILVVIINKGYIIKIVQMSLKRLFSLTTGRLGSLRVKFNDPNKDFKEAL